MKKDITKKNTEQVDKEITRKEAIKKLGKYAAVTAAATLIILSPKESQAQSPPPPGWYN
jgi:hypothetical protein